MGDLTVSVLSLPCLKLIPSYFQTHWLFCEMRYTVKPRKVELRMFKILANSDKISDTMDSENKLSINYMYFNNWSIDKNISLSVQKFGCVKETSLRDVSFIHPKHMFDREKTDTNNHILGII